jgi:hypothetical protein
MVRLWENDDQGLRDLEHMTELKEEMSKDIVDTIATARAADPTLKKCENRAKKKRKRKMGSCAGAKTEKRSR